MARTDLVFLVDVDNTLLDNDALREQLDDRLRALLLDDGARRFWAVYEDVRAAFGLVDIPETIARIATEARDESLEARLTALVEALPFADFLYPDALEVLRHLGGLGTAVILSDGDAVFQHLKIRAAGIEGAVDARVLVFAHKEQELDEVRRRFPAEAYAIFDDKPAILSAMKQALGETVTTVLVRQGKYAAAGIEGGPPPDLVLPAISDALALSAAAVREAARPATS